MAASIMMGSSFVGSIIYDLIHTGSCYSAPHLEPLPDPHTRRVRRDAVCPHTALQSEIGAPLIRAADGEQAAGQVKGLRCCRHQSQQIQWIR